MSESVPIYLKAFTVHDYTDIEIIKKDIKKGMILIIRVGYMAQKDIPNLRKLINELYDIAKAENGELARLGDERIVATPKGVQIWKPEYDLK